MTEIEQIRLLAGKGIVRLNIEATIGHRFSAEELGEYRRAQTERLIRIADKKAKGPKSVADRVREHVALHAQAQKSERIPVEKGGKKILIGIDKIRFVMARDDYAYLQTDTDRYFSTVSLAQLEKRLDGHGFFRVHRGYLVNLQMVEEVESVSGGTLLLTLNGVEEKIPVSRRRVSALKKALGL